MMTKLQRFLLTVVLGLLATAGLLLLPGCYSEMEKDPEDALGVVRYRVRGQFTAFEFRLSDGTRCVTVHSNGISCAWQQPPAGVE